MPFKKYFKKLIEQFCTREYVDIKLICFPHGSYKLICFPHGNIYSLIISYIYIYNGSERVEFERLHEK